MTWRWMVGSGGTAEAGKKVAFCWAWCSRRLLVGERSWYWEIDLATVRVIKKVWHPAC